MSYLQAIVIALVQGVTELFPISSLGHSVILPHLLGWDIHQNDSYFITFLVATHLATAIKAMPRTMATIARTRRLLIRRSLRRRV